jgi:beta-N-acetylhexosaminidase
MNDVERLIGRMLLLGFRGAEPEECGEIAADISTGRVGGVIFFDRDVARRTERNIRSPEQVKRLISFLREQSPEPLLVAVDQEGGAVARLKEKHGFPRPAPSARDLAASGDAGVTRVEAGRTAQTLAGCGFNLNFAPVVDLDVNPDNPVIGRLGRSFGADPETVIRHASVWVEEHRRLGVRTCLKHFPGHGSSTVDSHLGVADVSSTWSETELEPYARLIRSNLADMVMGGHLFHDGLDSCYPASLSASVITGILRRRLGYDGVVASDDLQMGAIADSYGAEEAAELAVTAGADLVVCGNNLSWEPGIASRLVAHLSGAVADGRISRERLEESNRRIDRLRAGTPTV